MSLELADRLVIRGDFLFGGGWGGRWVLGEGEEGEGFCGLRLVGGGEIGWILSCWIVTIREIIIAHHLQPKLQIRFLYYCHKPI